MADETRAEQSSTGAATSRARAAFTIGRRITLDVCVLSYRWFCTRSVKSNTARRRERRKANQQTRFVLSKQHSNKPNANLQRFATVTSHECQRDAHTHPHTHSSSQNPAPRTSVLSSCISLCSARRAARTWKIRIQGS